MDEEKIYCVPEPLKREQNNVLENQVEENELPQIDEGIPSTSKGQTTLKKRKISTENLLPWVISIPVFIEQKWDQMRWKQE